MKPGTRVAARYRIVRRIGRGGMGEVFEVVDEQLDRTRALKLLFASGTPDVRARFELEARAGGRVGSPFLVDVVDTGSDPDTDRLYLVMELLVGEDLGQRVARLGRLPAAEVVHHLGQLALALARMHERQIVHRDLKPSNLFVHERDRESPLLKVLDLGVAKELVAGAPETTGVTGTPEYMAPEQLRGRNVGAAVDLYALGLIAFTLLVGCPYWREARSLGSVGFGMVAVHGPPDPASLRARASGIDLPPAFDAWFARATAEHPEDRFSSPIAAVRALAAALAVPVPPWLPEATPARAEPATPPSEPPSLSGDTRPATAPPPSPPARPDVATAASDSGRFPPAALATPAMPASDVAAEPPPPIRRRRWRLVGVVIAIVATAVATTGAWIVFRPIERAALEPPPRLDHPRGVLACPIFEVDDPARDGWLGAAAASLACERARVLLGGRPERTRIPAELLRLPPAPRDDFPVDPYGAPDARPRSLAAAAAVGAYLDGSVRATDGGFVVELSLRPRPAGSSASRHVGESASLHTAVRAAMQSMIDGGELPRAVAIDPLMADLSSAPDASTALDLVDLALALAVNGGQLDEECRTFAARHAGDAPRLQFARFECAYTLGRRTQSLRIEPAADGASVGDLATRARIRHMGLRLDDPGEIRRLEAAYAATSPAWARSVIASTLSCLLQDSPSRAADALRWAQQAVADEPRNPTGEWCAPWDQLATLTRDRERAGVVRAMQAWQPWHPYAWWYGADEGPDQLEHHRRAYVLAPFNTTIAEAYASALLAAGRKDDAIRVADRLALLPIAVTRIGAVKIRVRALATTTQFGQALASARTAFRPEPDDAGWVLAQRVALAWQAVELAVITGEPHPVAAEAMAALIIPEPHRIDPADIEAQKLLSAICAHATPTAAPRCFDRIEQIIPALATHPFTAGARAYAAGDLRAAADAWRPLLVEDSFPVMADAAIAAFAAAGDLTIVRDLHAKASRNPPPSSTLASARAALALSTGAPADRALARTLAAEVLAAWRLADRRPMLLEALASMNR